MTSHALEGELVAEEGGAPPGLLIVVIILAGILSGIFTATEAASIAVIYTLGLTFLSFLAVLGLAYEWTHYLVHTDYKPRSAAYRAVWRNHRLHHFKNERYWFTVTSAGTADRVLGTYPDLATVPTSPTAKNLHALSA